jgi:hypothetical protein
MPAPMIAIVSGARAIYGSVSGESVICEVIASSEPHVSASELSGDRRRSAAAPQSVRRPPARFVCPANSLDDLVGLATEQCRECHPNRLGGILRLMTSSNCVGCSKGRSAGLTPFRILFTYVAARRNRSARLAPYDMSPPTTTLSRAW